MTAKRQPMRRPSTRHSNAWSPNNFISVVGAIVMGIVSIITALAAAWASLHSGQVKAKAEREVERREVSGELGRIHEQTNGHLSTMQAKVDAALKEIMDLKKSIADKAIERAGEDKNDTRPNRP